MSILTNPCMEGLVKIGKTTVANMKQRLKTLSNTSSVPVPFECYYAAIVKDAQMVEKRLHEAFGDHRISPRREFFKVSPHRVKAALELAALQEIFFEEDPEEAEEVQNYVSKRPPFQFSLAQIPVGAELTFVKDERITCKVADDKNIEFEGQTSSLSKAAGMLLKSRFGRKSQQVQGPSYWMYDGETLEERRQRIEMMKMADQPI